MVTVIGESAGSRSTNAVDDDWPPGHWSDSHTAHQTNCCEPSGTRAGSHPHPALLLDSLWGAGKVETQGPAVAASKRAELQPSLRQGFVGKGSRNFPKKPWGHW